MVVQLLPHQEKAVGELSNGKVLVGGVGTGKTVTALAYYYTKILGGVLNDYGSIKTPTDLYVFTTARKRDDHDWQKWAAHLGISTKKEYSLHGIQLVVDSYNNIEKYKDIKDSFVILDEQRLVGSGAWSRAFIKIAKSNRWIMLSATPGDTWMDYVPLFVANGFYKNRAEFKRDHCVYSYFGNYPKLERYISIAKLKRLERQILVEMPYDRHTTRHIREVAVDYDRELFAKVVKKRWHVYENRPLKDVAELFSVMRKVVNSDVSRLSAVRNLVQKHSRVIVFYNFDYELEMLRSLIPQSLEGSESSNLIVDISNGPMSTQKTSPTTSLNPPRAISVEANSVGAESHAANSVGPDVDLGKDATCELGLEDASKLDEQKFGSSKSPLRDGGMSVESTTSHTGDRAHQCDAPIVESSDRSIKEKECLTKTWVGRSGSTDSDRSSSSVTEESGSSSIASTRTLTNGLRLGMEITPRSISEMVMETQKCISKRPSTVCPDGVTTVRYQEPSSPSRQESRNVQIAEQSNLSKEDPWKWTIWAKDYQPPEDRDPREAVRSTIAKYEYEKWLRKSLPLSERESCQQTSQNSSSGSKPSANSSSTPGSRQYYSSISKMVMTSPSTRLGRSNTCDLSLNRTQNCSLKNPSSFKPSRPDDEMELIPASVDTTLSSHTPASTSSMQPIPTFDASVVEPTSRQKCGTRRTTDTITSSTATSTNSEFDETIIRGGQKDSVLGNFPILDGDTSVQQNETNKSFISMDQPVTIAEWNGHKHEPVPTSDSWIYLVQYVAGAEAWNCVTTDTVIFFSLTYSYKNFEQAQGRIDRLDTPFSDLYYYVLLSDSPIDRAVAKALKGKESFNERKYIAST